MTAGSGWQGFPDNPRPDLESPGPWAWRRDLSPLGAANGFIRDLASLTFRSRPDLEMLGCRFTASTYQDDLFAKLQIRCPGRIQTAVPRRKAEFLAGRYLCRRLLEPGGSTDDIPSGHHGQPLWPPGWIGSISHSSDLAIGAIAPTAQMGLLGIDAEPWLEEGIANQIVRTVLDVHEECLLREVWPLGRSLTLAFSAKESFFKAVYPRVGHYFDFDCVQLTGVDLEMGNLTFKVTSQLSAALGAYPEFTVHFNQTAHGVITLAWA